MSFSTARHAEHTISHPTLGVKLTGTLNESASIARYRGIQYAEVKKRWTRSTLLERYDGPVDATSYGPRCPQVETLNHTAHFGPFLPFEHGGQDDLRCLNLNVACPKETQSPLPVLVFIHGGAFIYGAASDPTYESTRLVQHAMVLGQPIVAVTINYRLGPFGFLAPVDLADRDVGQGNFGLHDQVVALEWVKRNIAGFGGDPQRVTVAGESAGGLSTHALLGHQERMSQGSKYFDRVILQSGTFGVMGFWDRARVDEIWRAALDDLDLEHLSSDKALEQMRQVPWQRLTHLPAFQTGGYAVYKDDLFVSPPMFDTEGDFLQYTPTTVSAIMHGDNADEGNIFREDARTPGKRQELVQAALDILGPEGTSSLLALYDLDDASLANIGAKEEAWRLHRFPEDARFYLLSERLNALWPNSAFYHLAAKSPFKASRFPDDSFHELDNLFLFGNFDDFLADEPGGQDHLRLGREMRTAWITFVNGAQPWDGAYEQVSARFDKDQATFLSRRDVRGWTDVRKERLDKLERFGIGNIVKIATKVFP